MGNKIVVPPLTPELLNQFMKEDKQQEALYHLKHTPKKQIIELVHLAVKQENVAALNFLFPFVYINDAHEDFYYHDSPSFTKICRTFPSYNDIFS